MTKNFSSFTGIAVLSGMLLIAVAGVSVAEVANWSYSSVLNQGFSNVPVVSSYNLSERKIAPSEASALIKKFCADLGVRFKKYNWEQDPCGALPWRADLKTAGGHPLLYLDFGKGEETTLVLSAVHPDEMTPVPMGFRFAKYVAEHPEVYKKDGRVIIAPLVNPDGFFRDNPTRTNANGIDTNRNFFTIDWYARSKLMWQSGRGRSLKHFPGYFPNSEIETMFQIQLMEIFQPDKILSVHAPLGFLDYDGPGDRKPRQLNSVEERAKQLVHSISKKTNNYRVVDYSFYPGSLGNYAGNERHVPTVTLELETTDHRKVNAYWEQFLPGLIQLVQYDFRGPQTIRSGNASFFYKHTATQADEKSSAGDAEQL